MIPRRIVQSWLILPAAALAACAGPPESSPAVGGTGGGTASAPSAACTPLETRPPNAPDQRPAFAVGPQRGQSTQRRNGCFIRPACSPASAPQPMK